MAKHVDIDIGSDGGVSIDAVGFSGPDCEQATKFLEEVLGTVREKSVKPEHRRRAVLTRKRDLRRGEA